MSFTRSTPPPYNPLPLGHGRNASLASTTRSGWAASFASHANSPRAAAFAQLDSRNGPQSPSVAGSTHSPRAASFSGHPNRLISPSASRMSRRISSPRGIPPLVIPQMRRRGVQGPRSTDGALPVCSMWSTRSGYKLKLSLSCRLTTMRNLRTRSPLDRMRSIAHVV